MLLRGSLNSSCPLFWTQSCVHGALSSTFQWCFYKMLDKWFACVKLWHRVLSLVLSAFQNFMLTVLLLTTKAASAALSLARLTAARVESPHVTALPRLGHECLKADIQARGLGLEAARDRTLICALWDWKHHTPAHGLYFCLLLCHVTVRNLFLYQTFNLDHTPMRDSCS